MNGSPRHCSTEGKLSSDAGKTISEEPTDNLGSNFGVAAPHCGVTAIVIPKAQ